MTGGEGLLAPRLEALLGAEAVRPGDPGAPARQPEVWVTPREEGQVTELLAWATRERVPVYPRGGATRWRAGLRPFRGGVGLDMRGLGRIEEMDPDNLTVEAGAGVIHADLQSALAAHRLFLPSETAWPRLSTLGGEVAADASGPRKYAYGSTRTYLLGARVVFPDGSGGLFGGKQVKNVSGYDVSRFLCGSWGSLGVVTRVILKVRPLPEQALVKAFAGEPDVLAAAAEEVRRDLYGAAAIELLAGRPVRWFCAALGPPGDAPPPAALLLVALEGAAEAVAWQAEWLDGLASRRGLVPFVLPGVPGPAGAAGDAGGRADGDGGGGGDGRGPVDVWGARNGLFERAYTEGVSVWNAAVPPAALARLLGALAAGGAGAPGEVAAGGGAASGGGAGGPGGSPGGPVLVGVAAHAGNGHVHLFMAEETEGGPEAGPGAGAGGPHGLEAVSAAVRALGGHLVADDAARSGSPHEVLPAVGGLAAVWKRLKGALDPAGIMCPAGRLGGEGA